MKNINLTNISHLDSDNLKDEINSFKNKFVNKSQYLGDYDNDILLSK